MLEIVKTLLSEQEWGELADCLDFLTLKTKKFARRCEAALPQGLEALIQANLGFDIKLRFDYLYLLALRGQFELLEILDFVLLLDFGSTYRIDSRPKIHEALRGDRIREAEDRLLPHDPVMAYHLLLHAGEIERFIKDGIAACVDSKDGWAEYRANPKNPADARLAFQNALLFCDLGLFERAERYLATLKDYPRLYHTRRWSGAYHPDTYADMTRFIEHLLQAKTAPDETSARRAAAQAILAQLKAVVLNYKKDSVASSFLCRSPRLACFVAASFDLDPAWSRCFMRAMFHDLANAKYPSLYVRARREGIWLKNEAELGMPPLDEAQALYKRLKAEHGQQKSR